MALDLRQNSFSAQIIENKCTEFHQILFSNSYILSINFGQNLYICPQDIEWKGNSGVNQVCEKLCVTTPVERKTVWLKT